jgi:hypothetical protein
MGGVTEEIKCNYLAQPALARMCTQRVSFLVNVLEFEMLKSS